MAQTKSRAQEANAANEPTEATNDTKASKPKTSKSAAVIAMLARPEGATIEALMNATGWQAHSVRGFLAGTLKKKMGKSVASEKTGAGRVYRIVEANAA